MCLSPGPGSFDISRCSARWASLKSWRHLCSWEMSAWTSRSPTSGTMGSASGGPAEASRAAPPAHRRPLTQAAAIPGRSARHLPPVSAASVAGAAMTATVTNP